MARTEAATTFRYTVTLVATGRGQPVTVQASGVVDRDHGASMLTADLSTIAPDLGGPATILVTPSVLFVDSPSLRRLVGAPTRWISMRGAGGDLLATTIVDPTKVLEEARRARGPRATGPAGDAPAEVVVGADGYVRRVSVRFDAVDGGSWATVSAEFFDVGALVEITPPAPEEVTDETDALNRLFGGATGG